MYLINVLDESVEDWTEITIATIVTNRKPIVISASVGIKIFF